MYVSVISELYDASLQVFTELYTSDTGKESVLLYSKTAILGAHRIRMGNVDIRLLNTRATRPKEKSNTTTKVVVKYDVLR